MDLTGAPWRKSSYSSGNGGACVEVAVVPGSKEGSDYVITMRDSKDPDGPVLTFTPAEWEAFTLGVQDGEFDIEDDSPARTPRTMPGADRAGELTVQPATPASGDLRSWMTAGGAGCGRCPRVAARVIGRRRIRVAGLGGCRGQPG